MPDKCCVPNCPSGHPENSTKRVHFSIPQDPVLRDEWRKMIPREVSATHQTAKVCDLHFEENDIIKGKSIIINGKEDFFPMRWKLRQGAVPQIISGCLANLNIPLKQRRLSEEPNNFLIKRRRMIQENGSELSLANKHLLVVDEQSSVKHCQSQTKPAINISLGAIRLPSLAWKWFLGDSDAQAIKTSTGNNIVCSESVFSGGIIFSRRSVKLNMLTGVVCYFVYEKSLSCLPDSLQTTFTSNNDISELLSNFNNTKLCSGYRASRFSSIDISNESYIQYQNGQILRSSKCRQFVSDSRPCIDCRNMKNAICIARPKSTVQPKLANREK